jgi:C1A family cysteine protease
MITARPPKKPKKVSSSFGSPPLGRLALQRKVSSSSGSASEKLAVRRRSWYGWNRDIPDERDFVYSAPLMRYPQGLPPAADLSSECPPVYDQGSLGSCTANAIAGAIEFDQKKQGTQEFVPSRLFIYYNERVIEGTTGYDSGAQIRDGIKTVATLGAPTEADWPYDLAKFTLEPPPQAYTDAKTDVVSSYSRVNQDLMQMRGCLASGFPFVFGFTVYESFESDVVAQTGIVPMPGTGEKILGGHAVLAVGYDDAKRAFIVRNSWGDTWGLKGYCMMPYEFLLSKNSSDFWTIRAVTG